MRRAVGFLWLLCMGMSVMAVDIMNLELDFGDEIHSQFWHQRHGQGQVHKAQGGAVLELSAGSLYSTDVLPWKMGKVKVSFDARCSEVTPNGEGWRVAMVQLTYFRGDKGDYHDDLFLSGEGKEWQHYESVHMPRAGITGFAVSAANQGKDGSLELKNLSISVELPGRNLLEDGSFEGMFGLDNWLQMRDGADWDKGRLARPEGKSEAVKGLFPGKGATALLTNTATVISRRFPYRGEGVLVGAWVRYDRIVRGVFPWAAATIQLIELDRDGRHIGHLDLLPTDPGSKPWGYHVAYVPRLSVRTHALEVWLRVFDGATGSMAVDEVSLVMVGQAVAPVPYDAKRGVLTIGPEPSAGAVIRPVWNGVDLSYVSYMGHPILKDTLRQLRGAGIEYVRCREFLQAPRCLRSFDAAGHPVFDFRQLDRWMDYGVKELGFKLVPTIETVPTLLMPPGHSDRRDVHPYPPKDPVLWGRVVKEVVRHWLERYGKEVVSDWIFECWNEPEASGFYKGTETEFAEIFKAYLRALTELEDEYGVRLRISTPSGASVHGSYFGLCFDAAREIGLLSRMSCASMHVYAGFAGPLSKFSDHVSAMRQTLSRYPELKHPEIHVTEFNGTAMVSQYFDTQVCASYLIRAVGEFLKAGVARSYFYCAGDHPYIKADTHFNGDLGIFTSSGMAKPVFNTYLLLQELAGGVQLPVTSSNEPFEALAVRCADGRIRVLVSSFNEQDFDDVSRAAVTLRIALPQGYVVTHPTLRQIDSVQANSHTAFVQDGSPLVKEHGDITRWSAAGKMRKVPLTGHVIENGVLRVTISMELNGVSALEL